MPGTLVTSDAPFQPISRSYYSGISAATIRLAARGTTGTLGHLVPIGIIGMPSQRRMHKKTNWPLLRLSWERFSDQRSSKAARTLLDENFVSISVPGGGTHRLAIEEITRNAARPIPIESLCDELNARSFIRGRIFFGYVGNKLDQIATSHDQMQWWISDKGLNVAIVPPDNPELSQLDFACAPDCRLRKRR